MAYRVTIPGIECSDGGLLRERIDAERNVLSQAFHRLDDFGGYAHPADPPSGHAVAFREAADDDHIIGKYQRAQLRKSAWDRDHFRVVCRQALITPPVPLSGTP